VNVAPSAANSHANGAIDRFGETSTCEPVSSALSNDVSGLTALSICTTRSGRVRPPQRPRPQPIGSRIGSTARVWLGHCVPGWGSTCPRTYCPNLATNAPTGRSKKTGVVELGQGPQNVDHVGQGGSGVGEAKPQDRFTITVGFLEVRVRVPEEARRR
jgi:hypothetical protein